jgi:hypothetical protein
MKPGAQASSVWTGAPDDGWVVAWKSLTHWDGHAWQIFEGADDLKAVWGRNGRDVWAAGAVLKHWDGQTWTEVARPKKGRVFSDVIGSQDKVWVLAHVPAPQDDCFLGAKCPQSPWPDDDILEIGGATQRYLGYSGHAAKLRISQGALWALEAAGLPTHPEDTARRWDGTAWLKADPEGFPWSLDGAVVHAAWSGFSWKRGERAGRMGPLGPGDVVDVWSDGKTAWAVGREGLIVRIEGAGLR